MDDNELMARLKMGDTDALAIAFGKMADRPLIHVLDADDFADLAQMCLAV